jgi:hypothetical protein
MDALCYLGFLRNTLHRTSEVIRYKSLASQSAEHMVLLSKAELTPLFHPDFHHGTGHWIDPDSPRLSTFPKQYPNGSCPCIPVLRH